MKDMVRESVALLGMLAAMVTGPTPASMSTVRAPQVVVKMAGADFSPTAVTVGAGATVRFENDDTDAHTVTDPGLFDSGGLEPGRSFSYRFTKPGIYHYVCSIHPWMKGEIVVRESK